MSMMEVIEGSDRQPAQPEARRVPVIWPWLLVGAAGLAVLWRDHLRPRRCVPVQPAQGALSQAVPQPVQLLRALLSQGGSSLAPGPPPWCVLPGELLGTDAGHVWDWREQPAVDGAADRVMIIEKTYPGGQRLSLVIGIILLGLAALWLAHPAWLLGGIGV